MEDDELMKKMEKQVKKKSPASKKRKPKKKENWSQLYQRLRDEELKRLGYIK